MAHSLYSRCWVSNDYALSTAGYMVVSVDGRQQGAHRLAFEWWHGYAPNVTRHTCDNRRCYNPTHLLDGTHADNTRDMVERGRGRKGREGMPPGKAKQAYDRERRRRIEAGTWYPDRSNHGAHA